MKRTALLVLALLFLPGCVPVINWGLDRAQCGLKCPSHKSCQADPSGAGVFGGASCMPEANWVCDVPRADHGPVKTCDCFDEQVSLYGEWRSCPKEPR